MLRDRRDESCSAWTIAGADDVRAGDGGAMRTLPGGEVVPFCAQLSAQHNFASATSGVSSCRSAALQQSMSIMPPMLHSLSPKCRGTPANALPKSTSKRNKDASRFFMLWVTLFENANSSQLFNCSLPGTGPGIRIHKPLGNAYAQRFSSIFNR